MDNQRLILFVALSFVLLLLWQAWVEDYGPAPQATAPATTAEHATPADTGADLPVTVDEPKHHETAVPEEITLPAAQQVVVETDVLRIVIDTSGGDLRQAALLFIF